MSSGFISEADIAERKKVRQELWNNTKKEGDPDQPPEEAVPDHRTLYEKLQEQKDKKQEEWEETHKLKNMVRGLEDDEVDFLDFVDNTKLREEQRIKAEEKSALDEFRKKVNEMQQKAIETEVKAELKPDSKKTTSVKSKKSSQLSLLSGAIKRKKSEGEPSENDSKVTKKSSGTSNSSDDEASPKKKVASAGLSSSGALHCVAVLPGLGNYSDSSDSDNETGSDSDIEETNRISLPRDLTGRIIHLQSSHEKGGCC